MVLILLYGYSTQGPRSSIFTGSAHYSAYPAPMLKERRFGVVVLDCLLGIHLRPLKPEQEKENSSYRLQKATA